MPVSQRSPSTAIPGPLVWWTPLAMVIALVGGLLIAAPSAQAVNSAVCSVGSVAQFNSCIATANSAANTTTTITLINDMRMTAAFTAISLPSDSSMVVDGNGKRIWFGSYSGFDVTLGSGRVFEVKNLSTSGGNKAGSGTILRLRSGDLLLRNVLFSQAVSTAGNGGAVAIDSMSSTVTIDRSSFVSNRANGVSPDGAGGAIYSMAPVTMSNVTIFNNRARIGGGAVVSAHASASVSTIQFSTISGNWTSSGGGSNLSAHTPSSQIDLVGSVISDPGGFPNCSSPVRSGSYSVIGSSAGTDTSCGTDAANQIDLVSDSAINLAEYNSQYGALVPAENSVLIGYAPNALGTGITVDRLSNPRTDPYTVGAVQAVGVANAVLGAWTPLGTTAVSSGSFDWLKPGLNNAVYALAEYDGYLYAGGFFDGPGYDSGGDASTCTDALDPTITPLNCIARQPLGSPTSPWEPVGGGLNNTVDAMVVMGDKLYVGGMFDNVYGQGDKKCTVSGPGLNCLASWNGSSWSPLPGGGVMRASETASTLYEEIAISMFPSTAEIVGGSFAAPSGGRLARLEVRLGAANQVSNPTNVTAAIYAADVNGRPTGSPLVTQAMNVTAVPVGAGASTNPTSPNWGTATVDFTGGPVLTSGSRYAFVLSTTDSVSNAFLMATTPTTVSGISRLTGPADDPQISAKSPPVFAAYFEPPSSGPFVSTLTATPAVVELPSTAATVGGSFVATSSGPLVRLEVQLSVKSQTSNPTNVTAAIYAAGVDGTPTGSPLVTQAMDFTEVPVGPDSAPFPLAPYWGRGSVNFVNPLNITSGSRYAFVLTSTDSASNALQMATTPQTITGFSLLTRPASTWQSDPSTPPAFAAYLPTSEAKVQNLAALGGSTLIASGGFSWAGGEAQELGGLVKWSAAGGSFTAPGVGGSFNSLVQSLLTDGTGNVYVGGDYEGEGSLGPPVTPGALNGIGVNSGAWGSTASWSPMSSGFRWSNGASQPGRVDALALLNGTVYAGGYFEQTGDGSASLNNLATWNGTTWQTVGQGLNYRGTAVPTSVRALAADEDRGLLYIGGTFNDEGVGTTGTEPCVLVGSLRCVTVWDTGIEEFIPFQWGLEAGDNGLTGEVKAFVVKGPDVYVGGNFNTNNEGGFPYQWTLKNVGKWTWNAPTGAVSTAASSNGSFTITGTGFIGVPRTGGVKLGSTPVSYTRSSATSITATVPCDLASGTYAITVDGVGGWGNVGTVAVTQRSCAGPAAPTATPTSTTTPAATPTPTPAPIATEPTAEQLQDAREVRPNRVPALSKGVPSGKAIVIVNGLPQKSNLTVWQQGMTVRTGPITSAVRSQSSSGANLAPKDGTLTITQSAAQTRERRVSPPGIQLTSSGYASSTPVRVFLVPQPNAGPPGARPLDLGYLMTDAQGSLQGKVSVRARRAGAFILQINGTGSDGLVRSINLPATVRR